MLQHLPGALAFASSFTVRDSGRSNVNATYGGGPAHAAAVERATSWMRRALDHHAELCLALVGVIYCGKSQIAYTVIGGPLVLWVAGMRSRSAALGAGARA